MDICLGKALQLLENNKGSRGTFCYRLANMQVFGPPLHLFSQTDLHELIAITASGLP